MKVDTSNPLFPQIIMRVGHNLTLIQISCLKISQTSIAQNRKKIFKNMKIEEEEHLRTTPYNYIHQEANYLKEIGESIAFQFVEDV